MKFIKSLIVICLFLTHVSKSQISVYGAVEHIVPDGIDTVGNIVLSVSGSTAPYTYTWNPGAINTKDISNITAGHYTVNILSASSQTRSANYKMGYKTLWTNLYRTTYRRDSLFIAGASSSLYASACSKNTLPAGIDGWFEYVITNLSGYHHYIGFADSLSPLITNGDIDYGFHYTAANRDIFAMTLGSGETSENSDIKIGDVLRIERTGNVIKYLINNAAVKTVTVSGIGAKTLKLKAYMAGSNVLANVGCSFANLDNAVFANYVKIKPYIKHVTGLGSTDGSIKATPSIPFANTYSWSPGGVTTNSVTSLSFGTYTLNIKDSLNNNSTYKLRSSYKAQWTNLDKCFSRNDSLVSTLTSTSKFTAAHTKNTMMPNVNGWLEYVLAYKGQDCYIGLTDSIGPYTSYTSIDYGFLCDGATGYLFYVENSTVTQISAYLNVGDIMSIERSGNSILYKQNGVTLRTVTVSGLSQKTLKVQCIMYGANRITDVGCSFVEEDSVNFKNYVGVRPVIKHCSGFGVNDGSIKLTPKIPFANTYSWTPGGASTNSISSVGVGIYSVTVKDSVQNQSPYKFNVGYKVNFTNLENCLFRNDSIIGTYTSSNQFSKAVSKNTLKPNEDGWFEMVIDKLGGLEYYIGFTDSLTPVVANNNYRDIDYGFYYQGAGPYIYYYQANTSTGFYYAPQIGDRISIHRVGNTIQYKINDITLASTTSSSIGPKALKIKASVEAYEKLCNIGCSFYKTDSVSFKNYVKVIPYIKHSSGSGINDASISVKPKLQGLQGYTWQPSGSNLALNSGLTIGSHSVIVKDSLANSTPYNYNVGYKAIWTNTTGVLFRNDTIKSTVSSGYGYGCSKNILSANVDGWFEFVIPSVMSNHYYIGFTDSTSTSTTILSDILYGIWFNNTQKYLTIYEGASGTTIYPVQGSGDVVRVERVGNTINYKVNGVQYRTVTSTTIGPKVLKLKTMLPANSLMHNIGMSAPGCILNANAGLDQLLVTPSSVTLGGSPSATGTPSSFSYTWTPNFYLSSSSVANPVATPTANTIYTLAVTNYPGCTIYDQVEIFTRQNEDYAKLYTTLNGGYYTIPSSNKLFFTVDGEYEQTGLIFNVYQDANHLPVGGLSASSSLINNGDNRYFINVSALASNYYILEIQNQKKEKLYLRFKK